MRKNDAAQADMTMRTAFELGALLILVAENTNPATDPDLRARLIDACNARDFAWALADEEGIHHGVSGQFGRTGLITWQRLWDRIGPGITPARVTELHAAIAEGAEYRARSGWHMDLRLHAARCAFYGPAALVDVPLPVWMLPGYGNNFEPAPEDELPVGQLELFALAGVA